MRTVLLGLAAACAVAAFPAAAQAQWRSSQIMVASPSSSAPGTSGDRRGHGHYVRNGRGGFVLVYDAGEWAAYNNQGWRSDSYNDWWHDRPDRAYPRWVGEARQNGTCTPDRMWWSGSGWHC